MQRWTSAGPCTRMPTCRARRTASAGFAGMWARRSQSMAGSSTRRIVHRQHRIIAARASEERSPPPAPVVEMQRHDGRQAPGGRESVAVVGRRQDLDAQCPCSGYEVVVAVAGGGQQQQDALHGSAPSEGLMRTTSKGGVAAGNGVGHIDGDSRGAAPYFDFGRCSNGADPIATRPGLSRRLEDSAATAHRGGA